MTERSRPTAVRLRHVLDAVESAVLVCDENFAVEDFNEAARTMLGAEHGVAVSQLILSFLTFDWRKLDDAEHPLAQAIRSKKPVLFRGYIALPNRRYTPVTVQATSLPPGAVLIVRDITRDLAAEKESKDFIGIASHQLRTPLSSVLWFIELLLSGHAGDVSKPQWEILLQAYNAASRLSATVRLLLDVSRIELGAIAITPNQENIQDLILQEVSQIKIFSNKKNQTILCQMLAVPPVLSVDKIILGFVLSNLLSNAVKYTPEKGTITVSLKELQDAWEISVTDTGYGIPDEAKPHIFQKFFRAENVLTVAPEGTGLGLYVARSLVDLWGGSIRFVSEKGQGTTFSFTIPKSGFRNVAGRTTVERIPQSHY